MWSPQFGRAACSGSMGRRHLVAGPKRGTAPASSGQTFRVIQRIVPAQLDVELTTRNADAFRSNGRRHLLAGAERVSASASPRQALRRIQRVVPAQLDVEP